MHYPILALGLALLLFGGEALVRGSVAVSVRLGIPTIVIGLTVVAFGTSAPELLVSLHAALVGATGIAIGNVVGSNIANVLLVLGLPALICAVNCNEPYIRRNMLFVLSASLLFIGLCFAGPLEMWHGVLLVSLMIVYLFESGRSALNGRNGPAVTVPEDATTRWPRSGWTMAALIVIGVVALALGARLTVAAASGISAAWGVSEAAIGLTIVALGTSLPELSATVVAAWRGYTGLALGNILGSNIFNLLAIMGITAMVATVPVPAVLTRLDLWVMLAAAVAIAPFVFARTRIPRLSGLALVAAYAVYIYFVFAPNLNGIVSAQVP